MEWCFSHFRNFYSLSLSTLIRNFPMEKPHTKNRGKLLKANNCLILLADKITSVGVFPAQRRKKISTRAETLPLLEHEWHESEHKQAEKMFNRIKFFRHQMAEPINERANVRLERSWKIICCDFKGRKSSLIRFDSNSSWKRSSINALSFSASNSAEKKAVGKSPGVNCKFSERKRHVITQTSSVINLKCLTNDYLRFRLIARSINSSERREEFLRHKLNLTASILLFG